MFAIKFKNCGVLSNIMFVLHALLDELPANTIHVIYDSMISQCFVIDKIECIFIVQNTNEYSAGYRTG